MSARLLTEKGEVHPTTERVLAVGCRDCGSPLHGFYFCRSKNPIHVECPICHRAYDAMLKPLPPVRSTA